MSEVKRLLTELEESWIEIRILQARIKQLQAENHRLTKDLGSRTRAKGQIPLL